MTQRRGLTRHWARTGALAALMLAAGGTGCRAPLSELRDHARFESSGDSFELEYAEVDTSTASRVESTIAALTPELQRWGGLKQPVRVRVMPTHTLLEDAVNKQGYGWLRAWSRYDEIYLQSPRTWTLFGATDGELLELLLHELTHCVMYQQAAFANTWARKQIPLWFREGMASYTARQGYRWPTLEDLAEFEAAHPELDPVSKPEALYQSENAIVYAAAHHAFTFLVLRYGEQGVRDLLHQMNDGDRFPDAFTAAIGVSPEAFVKDFQHYVRFRAFRSGRVVRAGR